MRRLVVVLVAGFLLGACGNAKRDVVLHSAKAPPQRLSEWGVVTADGRHFELNREVVPYDLNTPLFSDYALKLRAMWMPEGTSARYREDRELDFPVGTIISKTFHYEKADVRGKGSFSVVQADRESALSQSGRLDLDKYVLMETRLLIRYDDGWRALPYVWNASQDEAYLEIAGDIINIALVDGDETRAIAYVVPDANQCGGCHVTDHGSKELRPIGPKAWQLNRPYSWWQDSRDQLAHWAEEGLLTDMADPVPGGVRWSKPGDASLQERAKAYLDANCAHCHNENGAADTSALRLNIDAPVDRRYGICKTPVAVGRGSGDRPYDIYPGRPDESILLYRMQHSDPDIAMPELGRAAVHAEAVALVHDWIAAMNGEC